MRHEAPLQQEDQRRRNAIHMAVALAPALPMFGFGGIHIVPADAQLLISGQCAQLVAHVMPFGRTLLCPPNKQCEQCHAPSIANQCTGRIRDHPPSCRCRREFTLYLSTRWDMTLERATFKAAVAPALKQMLDARGVSFGYMDPRSDLRVEDLRTPRGVDAILVGTNVVKFGIQMGWVTRCPRGSKSERIG